MNEVPQSMYYHEENIDLLSVPDDYVIAHCISGDMALGAGVALQIEKNYNVRQMLHRLANYELSDHLKVGRCYRTGRIYNMVTKEKCWQKPTYESLQAALDSLAVDLRDDRIKKLAIPFIGCGLDRLNWTKVSQMVKDTFDGHDLEIMVCYL